MDTLSRRLKGEASCKEANFHAKSGLSLAEKLPTM
jgi:hypothetical protein